MSDKDYRFVEWKEQFVSLERSNRVVHYFLKDSTGETTLAIIGTEMSVRHMFYIVADGFVKAFGSQTNIQAGYKWRSRREVVDWLTSMISWQHVTPAYAWGNFEFSVNGSEFPSPDSKGHLPSISDGRSSEIVWSGTVWICGKQLRHYPSFSRNGITIAVHSFVFVMGKGENHYLAYLEDIYEDRRGQKKVKVRWFHYSEEVKGVTLIRNPHPKEVFITPFAQVISAECVDGPASILSREHFNKCFAALSHALPSKVHMCFRQFRNNRIKSFDLTKLRGYFNQPILACLFSSPMLNMDSEWNGQNGYEGNNLTLGDNAKVGGKRTKSGRGCLKSQIIDGSVHPTARCFPGFKFYPANKKRRIDDCLFAKRLLSLKHVESHSCLPKWFRVDEKIELLCQDSGIRGCWFRCTISHVTYKLLKVCYDDVKDEVDAANLEEWIPAMKLAMHDKLGMRFSSRLTIRPTPPSVDPSVLSFNIGVAVDAWWSDGWWEGVVIGVNNSADDHLQIYFPGENLFMSFHMKDLRISRDWVGDHWIDIKSKPDVLSVITSDITIDSKRSSHSTGMRDVLPDSITASVTDVTGGTDGSVDEVKVNVMTTSGASSLQVLDEKMPPSPLKQDGSGKESETNNVGHNEDTILSSDVDVNHSTEYGDHDMGSLTQKNDNDHDMGSLTQKNDNIVLGIPLSPVESLIDKCDMIEPSMGVVA